MAFSHPPPVSTSDEKAIVFHHPALRLSFPAPRQNSYFLVAATFRWTCLPLCRARLLRWAVPTFECESEAFALWIQPNHLLSRMLSWKYPRSRKLN
jgi:hypothetical protein